MRSMRFVLSALLTIAWLPAATAFAVTTSEIVSLTKAGVSEPIILALIERDKTIFSLAPDQLIALQKDGVSDVVILAMLKSGRQEPPPPVAAAPPPPLPLEYEPAEPNIVLIGGPDQSTVPYSAPAVIPYAVPYYLSLPYAPGRRSRHAPTRPIAPPASEFRTMLPVPPAAPATDPNPRGIFFTTPSPRSIFFDR